MNDNGYFENGRKRRLPSRGINSGMICILTAVVFFLLSYITSFNTILLGLGALMLIGGVCMILDTFEHS